MAARFGDLILKNGLNSKLLLKTVIRKLRFLISKTTLSVMEWMFVGLMI